MSSLEDMLELILRAEKLPTPKRQFRFCERLWRFDFAWPHDKLLLDVQGGIWSRGGHVRGKGYLNDVEKGNEATLLGYKVLHVCGEHIANGAAIEWIKKGLGIFNND